MRHAGETRLSPATGVAVVHAIPARIVARDGVDKHQPAHTCGVQAQFVARQRVGRMVGARTTGAHAPPQVLTKDHTGSQRALPPANLHIGSNHAEAAQLQLDLSRRKELQHFVF